MGTVAGLIKHALMPFTKFDEDSIPALLTAFPRSTDASHGRHSTFRALSRPFHSVLQQISICKLFLKYYTRSRLQRVHRFADARTFVQLLYIDSRIHPRTASAAFSAFVLHLFRINTLLHVLYFLEILHTIMIPKYDIKNL